MCIGYFRIGASRQRRYVTGLSAGGWGGRFERNSDAFPTSMCALRTGPSGHHSVPAKRLQLFHPYFISVGASPKQRNVVAYIAEFCLLPNDNGSVHVRVNLRDRHLGKQRYNVSAKSG